MISSLSLDVPFCFVGQGGVSDSHCVWMLEQIEVIVVNVVHLVEVASSANNNVQ